MAHAPGPINKHLLSHDSDKWKPPLRPYEIVYPQKLLTWRYEKLGCPGIYHIPRVQCHLAIVKWLRHPLHIRPTILSLKARCCSLPQQEVTRALTCTHTHTHAHRLVNWFLAPPSLTCFKGGGAFIADKRPAAYCGARAQVELVLAHGLQVTQDPLGGVGVTDVYSLQRPHFSVVD